MPTSTQLQQMADKLRVHSLISTTKAQSGHPSSCLSCAEIISTLFFSQITGEDEFILSKGHAAPILYAAFAEAGCIKEEELIHLRELGSNLEGHPTPRLQSIQVATGSLGQGLCAAVGMALAKKQKHSASSIYVLLGDGELAEGSNWEAANTASQYKLNNLCAIIDANRLGQSGPTLHQHDLKAYQEKFRAFGWTAHIVDGHNIDELNKTFYNTARSDRPTAIIAKTYKGHKISLLEDKEGWHGKTLNEDQLKEALKELPNPTLQLISKISCHNTAYHHFDQSYEKTSYQLGENISTREAFGTTLKNIGTTNPHVIVIDADVNNSTKTDSFMDTYPQRSYQSFIAEQNMVGMATGFSAEGYLPYIATFATFLTRAHDFIRMALLSESTIKFIGSHSGISIGKDGASQMGLEDLFMFLNLPNTVVLYPSDAVSTQYLLGEMSALPGIGYLRTTREKTPVIYSSDEQFPVGGLKVLTSSENDFALVITAGITVHEALKAYHQLKEEGIHIRIIDLYSLQPFDATALLHHAKESQDRVIVVEDHYCNALGGVVSSVLPHIQQLCIRDIPHSGSPIQLRKTYCIDSQAIQQLVKSWRS